MESTSTDELREIERKEWHLWFLTLGLLVLYTGIIIATYFVIVSQTYEDLEGLESTVYKALAGLTILTGLFSAYIIHTRFTFQRVKNIVQIHAIRDSLTGLYNRYYFEERIKEEIQRVDRSHHCLSVLLCDIDRFKWVNDNRGHQTGDQILKKVSEAIQEATRGIDLACRWGGDEMVVVISNATREGVLIAADRIRKRVQKVGEDFALPIDVSIGVALYPEHGRDADELIKMADRALYISKKGGDKVHIGDEEYRLDDHAVKIAFQPIFETGSGTILAYEALSRDPQGKYPILELFKRYQAVGQLKELKNLCFDLQLRKAKALGLKTVFINVDFDVLHAIETAPSTDGVEVILEISEAEALHDVERLLETTKKWRAWGFKFAIDDFGAGFISLAFVAKLLPDYLKLDRSAIVHAVASEQFRKFLTELILAFKNYTREGIIAEGIETEKELQFVKEAGAYLVQGYLMGEPKELVAVAAPPAG
ncbi:MAG TPA: diguanylate cyclase [Nitrospiria bacterium]|nr:diguanylate cyclase [Nitrospiria bacterium]